MRNEMGTGDAVVVICHYLHEISLVELLWLFLVKVKSRIKKETPDTGSHLSGAAFSLYKKYRNKMYYCGCDKNCTDKLSDDQKARLAKRWVEEKMEI